MRLRVMNSEPVILAIETATSSCSTALCVGKLTSERSEVGNNIHSQVLLKMVDELFQELNVSAGQLSAVVVGQGPGSFTGLRIGVGVGQGIAYGAVCPMIGVSSLDALALQSQFNGSVVAAIDARMGEIYWCTYDVADESVGRQTELRVTPADQLTIGNDAMLVGNTWSEYQSQFSADFLSKISQLEHVMYPSAASLLVLAKQKYAKGELMSAAEFSPIYVRDNVAKKPTSKV